MTCGAVLFTPRLKGPQYFGFRVCALTAAQWMSDGSSHVVAQVELLPTLVARATWSSVLDNAWIIHFVDNDSVKAALVMGTTKSPASAAMVGMVADQESVATTRTWYSRVPSPSNIADDPSRLVYSDLELWEDACMSTIVVPSGLEGCVF